METLEQSEIPPINVTTSSPSVDINKRSSSAHLLLVLIFTVVTFTCDLLTCLAMKKAKSVHFSTKWYTCLSLVFDCLFVFIIFFSYVYKIFGEGDIYTKCFVTFAARVVTALSWVTVSLLIAEKAFCIYFPNVYMKYGEPNKVIKFTLIIFVCVVGIKILVRVLLLPWLRGIHVNINVLKEDEPILMWILGVCLTINLVSYIAIFRVVRQHARRITALNFQPTNQLRSYGSTVTIISIIFVFLAIHVPLFVILVYQHSNQSTSNLRDSVLVAMLIVCYVNPIVYAWRFREIRFIALEVMAKLCPLFRNKAENMRLQIFNIVPTSFTPKTTI